LAAFEITGTQTVSAIAETLGAPIAVCGVLSGIMMCFQRRGGGEQIPGSKGVISIFPQQHACGDCETLGIHSGGKKNRRVGGPPTKKCGNRPKAGMCMRRKSRPDFVFS